MIDKKYQIPKELGEKWIAALLSGEYRQGKESLHNPIYNTYCCMGVLGSVLEVPNENMNYSGYCIGDIIPNLPEHLNFKSFNENVCVNSPNYTKEHFPLIYQLAEMNDKYDKTFVQIVEWVKENVEFV